MTSSWYSLTNAKAHLEAAQLRLQSAHTQLNPNNTSLPELTRELATMIGACHEMNRAIHMLWEVERRIRLGVRTPLPTSSPNPKPPPPTATELLKDF